MSADGTGHHGHGHGHDPAAVGGRLAAAAAAIDALRAEGHDLGTVPRALDEARLLGEAGDPSAATHAVRRVEVELERVHVRVVLAQLKALEAPAAGRPERVANLAREARAALGARQVSRAVALAREARGLLASGGGG